MFEQQLTFPNLFAKILLSTIVEEDMEEKNVDLCLELAVVTISFFEWYGQQFISYITSAQGGRMLCHAKPHELHSGTQ